MTRPFWKWHGLGNDFMLLTRSAWADSLSDATVSDLADRHRGVGFDQLLIIDPQRPAFAVRNADGSPAQQCGNGLRCVAAWLHQHGYVERSRFELASPSAVHDVEVHADSSVSAAMGEPKLGDAFSLNWQGQSLLVQPVDFGNPHAVVRVQALCELDLAALAAAVRATDLFPDGVNVGALQVSDQSRAQLAVFERGSGATQACGSGACAAMAAARHHGWLGREAVIAQPGGDLMLRWDGAGDTLWMRGAAVAVYAGEAAEAAFSN